MFLNKNFILWIFVLIIEHASGQNISSVRVSYNQPSFNACTTWATNGITFAQSNSVGTKPYGIFINSNNTIYGADGTNNRIVIWFQNRTNLTVTMTSNSSNPYSIFVAITGYIYVNNDNTTGLVNRRILNSNNITTAMIVGQVCYGLFVDLRNMLYCSMRDLHQIIGRSLNSTTSEVTTIIAGTGCPGANATMLNYPHGIFVNIDYALYVADCGNNRIQKFASGDINGTKISINTTLNCPTGVTLDSSNNVYIVDSKNHRIIRTQSSGYQCLIGCSGSGSGANQLLYPQSMAFDSYGNMYVTDRDNSRIQKFLVNLVCEQTTMAPTTTELVVTTQRLISNPTCVSPTVSLVPTALSMSTRLQFRRSQDFYIISIINIICNDSSSITTQWIIKNCSSTCTSQFPLDSSIVTTLSELYIPGRTLPYGVYELTLTVTMTKYPLLKRSVPIYIEITPSGITANLVLLGTSMITSGFEKDLKLDPGSYSADPDKAVFNASEWKYTYYCRIYGYSMFPTLNSVLLPIENSTLDPNNPSCLINRTDNVIPYQFGNAIKSSLTIVSKSLRSNRTYQFMVYMANRKNSSVQATGYVLVKVEDTRPQLIAIGCVIWTLCVPNLEFQLVNPTTQVALYALCVGNCTNLRNITWNIYYGSNNASSNITAWTLFNDTRIHENDWFFGTNTSNFTAANKLFLNNRQSLWRFQVVYTFLTEASSSAINFLVNVPPSNGSCSTNTSNGTTSTVFKFRCADWFDEDGIKDYSLYSWTTDPSQRMLVAFSGVPLFQALLQAGDDTTHVLNLVAIIRDTADCATEYNLTAVTVFPDIAAINDLINSADLTNNPTIQALSGGNQNTVGQILTSISQEFNKRNDESINKAASGGIPAASISISSLGSSASQGSPSTPFNETAMNEFNKDLNAQANVLEVLIAYTKNLGITSANGIKLQSLTLAQMTKSTNQLTRETLGIAADRCYQLAKALYSFATITPYEDVQTCAIQLTQCATNILSAVNGPLQQRTTILDADSSRATSLPDDYETDLESEWSNLNLFADGNDFSWETIQKGRNTYYQQQLANQVITQVNQILSLLTLTLKIHINIGQNISMNTSAVYMSLETRSYQSLSNKIIKQVGNSEIKLPTNLNSNISDPKAQISIRSKMEPLASYGNSKTTSNTNLSTTVSLSIFDEYGNEVPVQTNSDHPIEIIIPRDPNLVIPGMNLQNVIALNATPHQQLFNLHYINITSTLSVSVHFEMRPLNASLGYLLIYRFDQSPQLNTSINQIDGWSLLCPSNLSNDSIYTYFINNQQTSGYKSVIVGLRELNSTEINNYCSNSSNNNLPITDQKFNFTSNYELRVYTSGCYYLDNNNNWKSDGLTVGSLTNHNITQCFSTHLTTFAGGFIVLPEPINWSYVFANADFMKNKTIYLTVISVFVIYIILLIFSRYKDRKDVEKLGVTPLPDNHKSDQYFYQIIVFTGQRRNAGTKSNVHFVLSGDDDETQVRTLADPHRQILQRGGVDAFIMAVPKSLGLLNCIRIWHDNSGQGASSSWFLKYIIIRDLQTMEKFHFISQKWFAVEKDDEKIERVIPVAGVMEKSEFSYLLSKQAYHSVSDGHLWFSIFSRPPSNKFTRVQRCTCCFVLLFLSMFLNIMYYDLKQESELGNSTGLVFGPVRISADQISIGIIVELLALLPSLLLVQMFRRIRSRRIQISPLRQALYKISPTLDITEESTKNVAEQKKKKEPFTFPWWFIFIAYGLSVILLAMSIIFIIARGIEFGDVKTQKWLISILSGFFSSILLTQPIKILCLAIFFACFCRKSNDDKEANEHLDESKINLENDEEYLHLTDKSLFTYRPRVRINRLNQAQIACARLRRIKEIQMWSVIREALIFLGFLTVLSVMTYTNRHIDSFLQVDHLKKYFTNLRQIDLDYTKIVTIDDYWDWLENSFILNIRAQQWYNNEPPRNLSGFINDKSNRMIGWATMRQLRIKSEMCSFNNLTSTCEYDYSFSNEEKRSFTPGWSNLTTTNINSSINQAFQYKSSSQLDTYIYMGDHETYGGGGYVYEFRGRLSEIRGNLSELYQLRWIDNVTRAVIIQLNLYNPNAELFTSVSFLTEFLSTGAIYPQIRVEPMNFYAFTSILQLICIIIYMMFIIYFMVIQVQTFLRLKWKYFREFWSLIDLGIIICSWMAVGIYIMRYRECSRIGDLFAETNGYAYVNLQYSVYINDFLTYIYGFCCFFGTIKMVRLCQYNSRIYLFIKTLQYAGKELLSFAFMFSIVFFAFTCLFYLLFVAKLQSCSSLLHTTQMLFEITLMKFDAQELTGAAAFLGPFCFTLFILIVVFICMSMFLTIINESFRRAREDINKEQEIYAYMLQKFQLWTGLKKRTDEEIQEELDEVMRSEYYHPVEHFPDKVDQLLDALNRLHSSQAAEISKMDRTVNLNQKKKNN